MGTTRLPVVLVAGMHRDVRRATVQTLLEAVPGSIALHHDLVAAAHGKVVRIVRDAVTVLSTGQVPVVDDSAQDAVRGDLVPELLGLANEGDTRLAVVDLWDSIEPQAMAEAVDVDGGERLAVTSVMTAVDPADVLPFLGVGDDLADIGLATRASDSRTVADTWARQLEYAPVLVLAESPEADEEDRALLAQLHPTARHVPLGDAGELARMAFAGFDVEAAAARRHPSCALLPQEAEAAGVGTYVWHRDRPFHPERLYRALEDLCCAAARSRGRFWLADRPDTMLAWDCAGGALCVENHGPWLAALPDEDWTDVPAERRAAASLDWHPVHGDRCQHLVFTSPGLARDHIGRLLDSCLLTDAEYAEGREAWERLESAFDSLPKV